MVRAGDDNAATEDSAWTKVMQKLGLSKPAGAEAEINYTERSPLVVPPSRDLPPPAAAGLRARPGLAKGSEQTG